MSCTHNTTGRIWRCPACFNELESKVAKLEKTLGKYADGNNWRADGFYDPDKGDKMQRTYKDDEITAAETLEAVKRERDD